MTIGIGILCDDGDYAILASDSRVSYGKDLHPNDEAGKQFDFHPLRLVCSIAGRLGITHDLISQLTVEFDKLAARQAKGKPIYREHVENAIDEARVHEARRRYNWATKINYGISLKQLLSGKLPHGELSPVIWEDVKKKVFTLPLLAEVIVGGFLDDEPALFKASGKRDIEGDADPPVFVIGSKGAKYAMQHLNQRGQNITSGFAQSLLHVHEALKIAKDKDEDHYIGDCRAYVILNRTRNGFEQVIHDHPTLVGWAKHYADRQSTDSLNNEIAKKQAEAMLMRLQPGPRSTPKRSISRKSKGRQ